MAASVRASRASWSRRTRDRACGSLARSFKSISSEWSASNRMEGLCSEEDIEHFRMAQRTPSLAREKVLAGRAKTLVVSHSSPYLRGAMRSNSWEPGGARPFHQERADDGDCWKDSRGLCNHRGCVGRAPVGLCAGFLAESRGSDASFQGHPGAVA